MTNYCDKDFYYQWQQSVTQATPTHASPGWLYQSVQIDTNQYLCSYDEDPKCPPGSCGDDDCSFCESGSYSAKTVDFPVIATLPFDDDEANDEESVFGGILSTNDDSDVLKVRAIQILLVLFVIEVVALCMLYSCSNPQTVRVESMETIYVDSDSEK